MMVVITKEPNGEKFGETIKGPKDFRSSSKIDFEAVVAVKPGVNVGE